MRFSLLFLFAGCATDPSIALAPVAGEDIDPQPADVPVFDGVRVADLNLPVVEIPDGEAEDIYVGEAAATQVIWELYPDLDFGEDVMFGFEEVDGVEVPAYMMSAVDGFDVVEVLVDARTGEFLKEVVLEDFAALGASSCTITAISRGTMYRQGDSRWSSTLLGNSSSDTIGAYGCVITDIAMMYTNIWGRSQTPSDVNSWARSAGCFGSGSSSVNIDCAADRYSSHSVSSVSMSNLASEICAGNPILFKRNYGSGYHYVLGYHYTGGSTSSTSSYYVADPLTGTGVVLYGTAASSSPYRKWN